MTITQAAIIPVTVEKGQTWHPRWRATLPSIRPKPGELLANGEAHILELGLDLLEEV